MNDRPSSEPASPPARRQRPIGGFLGIELPAPTAGGFLMHWRLPGARQAFQTARSSLQGLLAAHPAGQVWLPAYLCPELSAIVPAARRRFYPVDSTLSPSVPHLRVGVAGGDLVLAVNYFGRPPGPDFIEYAGSQASALFVEDCAQALDTGRPAWGDWQLYSPRKLLGVPDGGMLVARSARAAAIELPGSEPAGYADAVDRAQAQWSRFEDDEETANEAWYPLHRAKEARLGVSMLRISRLSWELLGLLDVIAICAARRRNYDTLAARLPAWAVLAGPAEGWVPLGFPVRVAPQRRAAVLGRLLEQRLFPAIHWDGLPAPAAQFPFEWGLAASILTLPCDQRYAPEDMERLAAAFIEAAT